MFILNIHHCALLFIKYLTEQYGIMFTNTRRWSTIWAMSQAVFRAQKMFTSLARNRLHVISFSFSTQSANCCYIIYLDVVPESYKIIPRDVRPRFCQILGGTGLLHF